jgi:hypothetical protein
VQIGAQGSDRGISALAIASSCDSRKIKARRAVDGVIFVLVGFAARANA